MIGITQLKTLKPLAFNTDKNTSLPKGIISHHLLSCSYYSVADEKSISWSKLRVFILSRNIQCSKYFRHLKYQRISLEVFILGIWKNAHPEKSHFCSRHIWTLQYFESLQLIRIPASYSLASARLSYHQANGVKHYYLLPR